MKMIVSASRRTDIPAFYAEWFMNRLTEGYVLVKNPRNPRRSSRVLLTPAVVDCIVFWTKNPRPMLDKLAAIEAMGYPFYFQFTLTPYDSRIEKGLPPKKTIVETFQHLSDIIGPQRLVWRYDPVILNRELSVAYHLASFQQMVDALGKYTHRCIFSFVDSYARNRARTKGMEDATDNGANRRRLAAGFAQIAGGHAIELSTCAETMDVSEYGIIHGACIDQAMVEAILGCPIKAKKDMNQRAACGCMASVDIGCYDSCLHDCIYCYATANRAAALNNWQHHNKQSPFLIGAADSAGTITDRAGKTLKVTQLSLL